MKAAGSTAEGERKLDASTPEKRTYYIERLTAQLPEYNRRKAESGQSTIPLAATWFNQDRANDEFSLQEATVRRGQQPAIENDYPEYVRSSFGKQ